MASSILEETLSDAAEVQAMCTDVKEKNGGAQIRWAINNDYCMDIGVPLTCATDKASSKASTSKASTSKGSRK
jgi:hypothetical protein